MRSTVACCLLLICGFLPLAGQASLQPTDHSETWHDKIPVSGELRVGLVTSLSYTGKIDRYCNVYIPEGNYAHLHLSISTKDGRFTSTQHYNLDGITGERQVGWETTKLKELTKYSLNDIALLAWVTIDKDGDKSNFVPASWSDDLSTDHYYVLLLSRKKTLLNIYNSTTDVSKVITCEKFKERPRVSYNRYCKVPVSLLEGDTDITIIQKAKGSDDPHPLHIITK